MGKDNSYTSLYKAISCEPIKRAGGVGERIVFGLMLVVLICNFSSVWAQRKNKPIRKQRQTTFQPDNAVLIYSLSLLLFVSLLYSLSCHPSPPLSPSRSHCCKEKNKVECFLILSCIMYFMWLNNSLLFSCFSFLHLFLFSLCNPFLSFFWSLIFSFLFHSSLFLPLLFSLPLRWALSQLSVMPPEQHRGGATPQWDRPPRGQSV